MIVHAYALYAEIFTFNKKNLVLSYSTILKTFYMLSVGVMHGFKCVP